MDIAGDDAGVWMTYDELAVARDIKRDGARRLAQRHRWRRHAGNDGLARVLVPPEWLPGGAQAPRDSPRDIARNRGTTAPGAVAPDVTGVVTALQGAIDTLRQQLVRAEARGDELRAERDQARAEAQEAAQATEAIRRADAADEDRRAAQTLADQSMTLLADAEAAVARERHRADEFRTTIDELKAGQALMTDMHARELAAAQDRLERVRDAAEAIRQADADRKARGLVARLRAAWRGE